MVVAVRVKRLILLVLLMVNLMGNAIIHILLFLYDSIVVVMSLTNGEFRDE